MQSASLDLNKTTPSGQPMVPPYRILSFGLASNFRLTKQGSLIRRDHACVSPGRSNPYTPPLRRPPVLYACVANDEHTAIVLSHFEARGLLNLRNEAAPERNVATIVHGDFSVDVGYNNRRFVRVLHDGINIPMAGEAAEEATEESHTEANWPVMVTWGELEHMCKKKRAGAFEVFTDGKRAAQRITALSDETGRMASLLPVAPLTPPTLVLGGFTMHRVAGTNPAADTASKLACIPPHRLRGRVLDICTGLGYSALAAADSPDVQHVTTIELDPTAHEMIRRNPWSRRLIIHEKVDMLLGEAQRVIETMEDGSFNAVFHDPPVIALAGDLYGLDFYRQLYRVCSAGAALFHYIGNPSSKHSGKLFRGVKSRLTDAGFENIVTQAEAFGVSACKGR